MRTLVTAPIRSLAILGMVLEWREPSIVIGHLTVTSGLSNSMLLQVVLVNWELLEKLLAEEALSALARSRAAMSAGSPGFAELRIENAFRV